MVPTGHPSFPHPSLQEVICEFHIKKASGQPVDASVAGDLFKAIQDDFPKMVPRTEVGMQIRLDQSGMAQVPLSRQRFSFKHRSKPLVLQIVENTFVVNVLPPYPGWAATKGDVLHAWTVASRILTPSTVARIGLRYINRLERAPNESLSDWLHPSDYVSRAVLSYSTGFLSRTQVSPDRANRFIVTVAEMAGPEPDGTRPFVFDIDRVIEQDSSPTEEAIASWLEILHEDVWRVFSDAKGQKLDNYLLTGHG